MTDQNERQHTWYEIENRSPAPAHSAAKGPRATALTIRRSPRQRGVVYVSAAVYRSLGTRIRIFASGRKRVFQAIPPTSAAGFALYSGNGGMSATLHCLELSEAMTPGVKYTGQPVPGKNAIGFSLDC
jgi:hypothetical protein